ncbi:MAG: FMN-binding protein [Eubacterium sp.]
MNHHLSASVVIKNDRVAEINNVTGDGDSGNNSYIKRAVSGTSGMTGMVSRIIGMAVIDMSGENAGAQVDQNLTELDTVSRATCTSKSIKEACREALRQAREKFLAETESARNEDGEG